MPSATTEPAVLIATSMRLALAEVIVLNLKELHIAHVVSVRYSNPSVLVATKHLNVFPALSASLPIPHSVTKVSVLHLQATTKPVVSQLSPITACLE